MKNLYYDIKYLGLLKTIKFAWQRVARGYDSRIYWEFDSYFSQFIPPLKTFCEEELARYETMELNKVKKEVFEETIKRIIAWEKREVYNDKETPLLWEYFGKNILHYWN